MRNEECGDEFKKGGSNSMNSAGWLQRHMRE
jgi:hypothetical protein